MIRNIALLFISVLVQVYAVIAYCDIVLPSGQSVDWGKEPVINLGSGRSDIVLNGLWEFQPLDISINKDCPLDGAWGYISVPGTWTREVPGLLFKGRGVLWESFSVADLSVAWYRRDLFIPPNWTSRMIEIEFEHVGSFAQVWIDNRFCGSVQAAYDKVNLSDFVSPGKTHKLDVKVFALKNENDIVEIEGPKAEQVYTRKVKIEAKGLTGDVVLHSKPVSSIYNGTFIIPSVRKKELGLIIELAAEGISGSQCSVKALIRELDGKIVKEFETKSFRLEKAPDGICRINLDLPWTDPVYWDFEEAKLYNLELVISANGKSETVFERFGFREFYIIGKDFYLNGRKFNLRPVTISPPGGGPPLSAEVMNGNIAAWKKAGFNICEIAPVSVTDGKLPRPDSVLLDCAALNGWPVIACMPPIDWTLRLSFTKDIKAAEQWKNSCRKVFAKYRNNPAVFMWVHSVNPFSSMTDQDPRYIGQPSVLNKSGNGVNNALPAGYAASEFLKSLDPSRPNFSHAGQVGDVYSANNYLSFIPLQEQEEWLSEYMQHGEMPYLAVEFGFIPGFDFRRGRSAYVYTNKTEKMMTEYLAGFFGNAAYEKESMAAKWDNARSFLQEDQYVATDRFIGDELAIKLFADMIRRVYRSWRCSGISGGMELWMLKDAFDQGRVDSRLKEKFSVRVPAAPFKPGSRGFYFPSYTKSELYGISSEGASPNAAALALMEVNSSTLAWIAGHYLNFDPVSFTDKSHNYYSGENLQKQIVMHNDTKVTLPYDYVIRLCQNGNVLNEISGKGNLGIGEKAMLPILFKVPVVDMKTDFELQLYAEIGNFKHRDQFPFRVFPERRIPKEKIIIYDPEGVSSAFLRKAAYDVENLNILSVGKGAVIIGRNALANSGITKADIAKFIEAGNNVLILSQKTHGASFRYGSLVQRQVFPVNFKSPVLRGLDAEDLRDWRGRGTLLENYPPPRPVNMTDWGWHWGNRGSVSSKFIEKPHHGSWTPILECDFDLQYTPLMEMSYGKGTLILSQLDFEDNLEDPAAMCLFDNLIQYLKNKDFQTKSRDTVYMGSSKYADLLKSSGLIFQTVEVLTRVPDLLIIGEDANIRPDDLKKLAAKGVKIFVIGDSAAKNIMMAKLDWSKDFTGLLKVPDWKEFNGLSISDLRWRSPLNAELIISLDSFEIEGSGLFAKYEATNNGLILLSLIDPSRFKTDKYPYLRFTRWRQTRAMSQILSNLGAQFSVDSEFFKEDTASDFIAFANGWKAKFTTKMGKSELGLNDPGISQEALNSVKPEYDDSLWSTVNLPFVWQQHKSWPNENGEVVFRKSINIPEHCAGKEMRLNLGIVDDSDMTFFNGELIGSSKQYRQSRSYLIPGRLVKAGKNIIAVRVFDNLGDGGFIGHEDIYKLKLPDVFIPGLYHSDYRGLEDFKSADHPHRYHRW